MPALRRKLRHERRLRVGRDVWYLTAGRSVALAYRTRGSRVLEVGIADRRLTKTRSSATGLLRMAGATPAPVATLDTKATPK